VAFRLASAAIAGGQPIPRRYSCEENSISPPLAWPDPPVGIQSFAVRLDDPDAPHGVFTHGVLYGIPAGARAIPENGIPGKEGPHGSRQGRNSAGQVGYSGPCPPNGIHRYVVDRYTLDTTLDLPAGATKRDLIAAMSTHIIAKAQLTGTYQKHTPGG
jgi:Raf kinase inhibitor-like YbhB/YbcL family protein